MKRRRRPSRAVSLTAAPHATPTTIEVDGNVWRVGIRRRDLLRVNTHVQRAYPVVAPRIR